MPGDIGLHIHSGSSGSVFTCYTNGTTGAGSSNGVQVGIDGSENGCIKVKENKHFFIWTNSTERMRITNAGNVGINNTSPAQKLDVNGNAVIGTEGEEMFIGNIGHNNWAGIAHEDRVSVVNYALMQSNDGHTRLNVSSGKYMGFMEMIGF